jgi:hypothetical protein
MFEDSEFEMYETTTKLNFERDEDVKRSNRHILQMREVLDIIKEKYYEIVEHTAD